MKSAPILGHFSVYNSVYKGRYKTLDKYPDKSLDFVVDSYRIAITLFMKFALKKR